MVPLPSLEGSGALDSELRELLLAIARASIRHGLTHGRALPVDAGALAPELTEARGAFVTLSSRGDLRGCIGHISASGPLAEDIAALAFMAAFRDPRFPPVTGEELADLRIELSLLTVPEPISFTSEPDLAAQLVPGLDGLILQAGSRQGVFLPAVWESLPEPMAFLRHLKTKAGLSPRHPAEGLEAFRFHTQSIREADGGPAGD
jgi:AmmeMemoRadiSam system protein A